MDRLKKIYEETFSKLFKIVRNEISYKFVSLNSTLKICEESISEDLKIGNFHAHNYFNMFRLIIETKITNNILISLSTIQKLIALECFNVNNQILQLNYDGKTLSFTTIKDNKRYIIDDLIEILHNYYDKDDKTYHQTLLNIIFLLINQRINTIKEKHLSLCFELMIKIYSNAKPDFISSIRLTISMILNLIFSRCLNLEYNNEEIHLQTPLFSLRERSNFFSLTRSSFEKIPSIQQSKFNDTQSPSAARFLIKKFGRNQKSMDFINFQSSPNNFSAESFFVEPTNFTSYIKNKSKKHIRQTVKPREKEKNEGFNIILQTLKIIVENIIDNSIIYVERKKKFEKENTEITEYFIPLRCVPQIEDDVYNIEYSKIINIDVKNEKGIPAGKFGWCSLCRMQANFYCRNLRIPICSAKCKKILNEYEENFNSFYENPDLPERIFKFSEILEILKTLNEFAEKETTYLVNPEYRAKQFCLEILAMTLDYFGNHFYSSQELISQIKEKLCNTLIKNCVHSDKHIYIYSFKIFLTLILFYKEVCKDEILIFFDNITLKLLNSGNSSFSHKLYSLKVIHHIFDYSKTILEFFINFDCSVGHSNVIEKLIELLSKISQGKYLKDEFSLLRSNEEMDLRVLALESLVNLMISFVKTVEIERENLQNQISLKKNIESSEDLSDLTKPRSFKLIEDSIIDSVMKSDSKNKNINYGNKFDDMDSSDAVLKEFITTLDPETFQKEFNMKQEASKAIQIFNTKPENGIKHLFSINLIKKDDAKALAEFLRNSQDIFKDKLGEYFGKRDAFIQKVMMEFTNLFNFSEMTMDQSLRIFLDSFTLPGESQQIDRIMQIFAQKYFNDNKNGILKSSDASYNLAYTLTILQTDLHNPQITEKIKFPSFMKIAKGINDGEDLPQKFLKNLYDSVLEEPLAIRQSSRKELNASFFSNNQMREDKFKEEGKNILMKGQEKMRIKKKKKKSLFITINNGTEYITPLLEMMWHPLLATFSVVFETGCEENLISLSVKGFLNFIKLACEFKMIEARETFLVNFLKYTSLNNLKEIKEKNFLCIKEILKFVEKNCGLLGSSWIIIIKCFSQLDYIFCRNRKELINEIEQNEFENQSGSSELQSFCNKIDDTLLHKIFLSSNQLECDSLLDLITALCINARNDLNNQNKPHIFCLKKLVEIANLNMDRDRFIWSKMWGQVSQLLSEYGAHSNKKIALFIIDSLKQLALNFLQKDELSSYNFQKEVLSPFEKIYSNLSEHQTQIKECILSCISSFIQVKCDSIKSGWKVILNILNFAISETIISINYLAHSILHSIIELSLQSFSYMINDLILTTLKFIESKEEKICLESIEFLKKELRYFIENLQIIPSPLILSNQDSSSLYIDKPKIALSEITEQRSEDISPLIENFHERYFNFSEDSILYNENDEKKIRMVVSMRFKNTFKSTFEKLWVHIFETLRLKCLDMNVKVLEKSFDEYFYLIVKYGYTFTDDVWKDLNNQTFKSMFVQIKTILIEIFFSVNDRLAKTIILNLMNHWLKIIDLYFCVNKDLLNEIITSLEIFTLSYHKMLTPCALISYHNIIIKVGKKILSFTNNLIINSLTNIYFKSFPKELMESENLNLSFPKDSNDLSFQTIFRPPSLNFNIKTTLIKCNVQLKILGIFRRLCENFIEFLTMENIKSLSDVITESYNFATHFNDQIYLRYCLYRNGFWQENNNLPSMLDIEKESFYCIMLLNIQAFNKLKSINRQSALHYFNLFIEKSIFIINQYNKLNEYVFHSRKESRNDSLKHSYYQKPVSKTPENKVISKNYKKVSFSDYEECTRLDFFDKDNKYIKNYDENLESLLKNLTLKENLKKISNFKLIICFIIQNLSELKISEIKKIKELAHELINLTKFGFSMCVYCMSCGNCVSCNYCSNSEFEEASISLNLLLTKIYDNIFDQN